MDSSPNPTVPSRSSPAPDVPASADQRLTTLSTLLEKLDDGRDTSQQRARTELQHQNRLVQVRLGLASSLFTALRAKHAPTASHCLRVALSCSSWGLLMELTDQQRDEIEVAALLHDVGKIGVPDHVLLKPGKLTTEEAATIDRHRAIGEQILLSCCASKTVLDIIKYSPAWYNGSKPGFDRHADALPLGSRIVAILDAFDAMTTDHVYRRAMSRERAMAELFEYAGSQFDPVLVEQFCDLLVADQIKLTADVARRWLHDLRSDSSNAFWKRTSGSSPTTLVTADSLFHQKLLDSMHDAVVFVDTSLRILLWNRAAERLTGLSARSVLQKRWLPSLIDMRDENDARLVSQDCPLGHALETGVQTLRRLTVQGRGGERLSVDAHMVPVIGRDGVMHGATLLLHDASSQITLEERVQTLHEKATRDPLTKVANRAEFDRVHTQFVETHLERGLPCALIICDIDHFKHVNDTYGHQAGDEALISFAALLQRSSRPGDLVARYGGEEFVMLCADCDNATATERAETIRRELEEMPQLSLADKSIAASFGVTEIQAGDTPETMLRRSDRALLRAKANGRNRVVQLGTGIPHDVACQPRRGLFGWLQSSSSRQLVHATLITAIPMARTKGKLNGFVSDHHAEILAAQEEQFLLHITASRAVKTRRESDRMIGFHVTLEFEEKEVSIGGQSESTAMRTLIHVTIHPATNRDRRRRDAQERARRLFASLKSYFMAQQYEPPREEVPPRWYERLSSQLLNRLLRRSTSPDS